MLPIGQEQLGWQQDQPALAPTGDQHWLLGEVHRLQNLAEVIPNPSGAGMIPAVSDAGLQSVGPVRVWSQSGSALGPWMVSTQPGLEISRPNQKDAATLPASNFEGMPMGRNVDQKADPLVTCSAGG